MIETDKQRRAYWARVTHYQHAKFPLRGRTERVKRNRALLAAGVIGIGGPAVVIATGGGAFTGPLSSVLGTTGTHYRVDRRTRDLNRIHNAGSNRLANKFGERTGIELLDAISPRLRRRLGFTKFHAPIIPKSVRRRGNESFRQAVRRGKKMMSELPESAWKENPKEIVWQATGEPVGARLNRAFPRWLGRKIERASLWNILGRGNLRGLLDEGFTRAEHGTHRVTTKGLTKAAEHIERPLMGVIRRHLYGPWVLANRAAGRRTRSLGRWLVTRAVARGAR